MPMRQRGMTLLEVMIAVVVLALGLIASAGLQLRALQATDSARRDTQAVYLAQGILENARAAGRLEASALSRWQAQIKASLGAQAQGRVVHSGDMLVVDIHWPGAGTAERQGINLQGQL